MKVKFKNTLLMTVILVSLLVMTTFAAGCIFNEPKSGNMNTTTVFFSANSSLSNTFNITFFYNESGTMTKIVTVTNGTTGDNQLVFNTSFTISSLVDGNYTVACFENNDTVSNWSWVNLSRVMFDSTAPTINATDFAVGASPLEPGTPIELTCTCSDATGVTCTETRTITKPDSSTVSVTTTPYTATGSDTNVLGEYTWNCSGVDPAGNSYSEIKNFRVDTEEEGGITTTRTGAKGISGNIAVKIVIIVLIIIIVAVGIFGYLQSKKKKK